jgi:predicted secreted protein
MNPFSAFVVFLIIWWVVLFMVLPIGVRGQAEDNDIAPGSEPGAPTKANMLWKVKITTLIAFILWVCVCSVIIFELIDLERLIGPITDL